MKPLIGTLLFVIIWAAGVEAQDFKVVTTQPTHPRLTTELIASSSTKVVKGAPFSAEAISESVQVLADGNKITRSATTRLYRDSEGRFRREEVPGSVGNSGTLFGFQQTISILDPVAGVRFSLNPTAKTAHRVAISNTIPETVIRGNSTLLNLPSRVQVETALKQNYQIIQTIPANPASPILAASGNAPKTESLGMRQIEGVEAEGTRSIVTMAAGAVGNERAFDIVYERWYSKELQMIVLSKHSDPRFGEQTYRLINVNRAEPERTLFMPSSDYKILSEPAGLLRSKPE